MLPIYFDLIVSFSLGADVLAPDSLRPNLMAALVLVYRSSQRIFTLTLHNFEKYISSSLNLFFCNKFSRLRNYFILPLNKTFLDSYFELSSSSEILSLFLPIFELPEVNEPFCIGVVIIALFPPSPVALIIILE
jgi:hypothetical protein